VIQHSRRETWRPAGPVSGNHGKRAGSKAAVAAQAICSAEIGASDRRSPRAAAMVVWAEEENSSEKLGHAMQWRDDNTLGSAALRDFKPAYVGSAAPAISRKGG
jgi:hypothetical protein